MCVMVIAKFGLSLLVEGNTKETRTRGEHTHHTVANGSTTDGRTRSQRRKEGPENKGRPPKLELIANQSLPVGWEKMREMVPFLPAFYKLSAIGWEIASDFGSWVHIITCIANFGARKVKNCTGLQQQRGAIHHGIIASTCYLCDMPQT